MPRKKLPKQRRKNHMLRILVSPTEHRTWSNESKIAHDGILSAFVRDRVNGTIGPTGSGPGDYAPPLWISRELAERIAASGRTADQLVREALDRAGAPSRSPAEHGVPGGVQ